MLVPGAGNRMAILTAVFLAGCIALVYSAFVPYRPLDGQSLFLVLLLGFVAGVLFLRQHKGRPATAPPILTALLPWLVAGFFFGNGALDTSPEIRHATGVVETRYSYRSGIRDTLVVRSWRPGHTTESILVSAYQKFFYPGETLTVGVKNGAFGLAWISSVSR